MKIIPITLPNKSEKNWLPTNIDPPLIKMIPQNVPNKHSERSEQAYKPQPLTKLDNASYFEWQCISKLNK